MNLAGEKHAKEAFWTTVGSKTMFWPGMVCLCGCVPQVFRVRGMEYMEQGCDKMMALCSNLYSFKCLNVSKNRKHLLLGVLRPTKRDVGASRLKLQWPVGF